MAPAESIIFVTQPGRNTLSHAVAIVVAVSLLLLLPANRLVKMHFMFCLSAICVALFAAQLIRFLEREGKGSRGCCNSLFASLELFTRLCDAVQLLLLLLFSS